MINLYKNIKALRQQNQWTQEELAKRMGYTDRSMIAKIEAGKVDLARSKIIEFAKVFNVPPGDLMDEDEWTEYTPPENTPTFTVPWTDKGAQYDLILTKEEFDFIIEVRKRNDASFYKRMKAYMDLLTGDNHANR